MFTTKADVVNLWFFIILIIVQTVRKIDDCANWLLLIICIFIDVYVIVTSVIGGDSIGVLLDLETPGFHIESNLWIERNINDENCFYQIEIWLPIKFLYRRILD